MDELIVSTGVQISSFLEVGDFLFDSGNVEDSSPKFLVRKKLRKTASPLLSERNVSNDDCQLKFSRICATRRNNLTYQAAFMKSFNESAITKILEIDLKLLFYGFLGNNFSLLFEFEVLHVPVTSQLTYSSVDFALRHHSRCLCSVFNKELMSHQGIEI